MFGHRDATRRHEGVHESPASARKTVAHSPRCAMKPWIEPRWTKSAPRSGLSVCCLSSHRLSTEAVNRAAAAHSSGYLSFRRLSSQSFPPFSHLSACIPGNDRARPWFGRMAKPRAVSAPRSHRWLRWLELGPAAAKRAPTLQTWRRRPTVLPRKRRKPEKCGARTKTGLRPDPRLRTRPSPPARVRRTHAVRLLARYSDISCALGTQPTHFRPQCSNL